MPPPDLMTMFAVPFGFGRHPDHARLNSSLRAYVLAHEQSGTDGANPRPLTQRNAALYESHFNLFRVQEPAIQELKAFCWDQLLALVGRLNGYDLKTLERLQIYNDCWFHVTRRGGFFGLHNHANASWSGVYCVDPGRADPGDKDSGLLSFLNPMIASAMYMDAANARMPLPFGYQIAHLRLEPGQLVLFPSWVLHDVKPFNGEGERITIAFNCWFNLPDDARPQ
ncbi:MAG: hypothetical protein JSR54_11255 [Proteobacteria bacterium]|nr:hypothetical protein [Pseudomonadota bacterium]